MSTEYTHQITIAVPEQLVSNANKLAAIYGLNAADINTFKIANHEDSNGNKYAVSNFVCRQSFLDELGQTSLPDTLPAHTQSLYDDETAFRDAAQTAMDAIRDGTIMQVVDKPLSEALSDMGISRIEQEETI